MQVRGCGVGSGDWGTYLHVQPADLSVLRGDKHRSWPANSPHFFRNGGTRAYVIAPLGIQMPAETAKTEGAHCSALYV